MIAIKIYIMTKNLALLLIFALLMTSSKMTYSQTFIKRNAVLMGSEFDFTIVAKDSLSAENYIDQAIAEIARIEELISDWKSTSQVSEVNQNAGNSSGESRSGSFSIDTESDRVY